MSVPLDRLYHYIENIAEQIHRDRVLIYRFSPHGSKKIEDLQPLRKQTDYSASGHISQSYPHIFCNDQEPLDYERYEVERDETMIPVDVLKLLKTQNINLPLYNLRSSAQDIYDKAILIHSEQRSTNLTKYQNNNFITAYYWSHALIALDWFRFAQYVTQKKKVNKTFLIYNRAWAGTREYRLKFAELVVSLGLENDCKMSINPVEPELDVHYDLYKFKNSVWRPRTVLENFFPTSTAHSHYSADFDLADYENSDIEIVLETLFDDERLHLTEKSLRPIACGQPFILAGTHGSLEYLRSYGFKTFGHIWDERYDFIENPKERLYAIADLMKQITTWLPHQRENKMAQAQAIADYNKKHFFSDAFQNLIVSELKNNLTDALQEVVENNTSQRWFARRKMLYQFNDIKNSTFKEHRREILSVVKKAREYYLRSLKPSTE